MSVMCIASKPPYRAETVATKFDRRQRLFLILSAVNTVQNALASGVWGGPDSSLRWPLRHASESDLVARNNLVQDLVPIDQGSEIQSADIAETDGGRITAPAEVHETSSGRSGRWAVVLFDDTHHSMDYVIWALLKTVPELSGTDATLIMLEAHNTGKGVVTLCGLPQAEKYRDSLRILQLGCEIEPGW